MMHEEYFCDRMRRSDDWLRPMLGDDHCRKRIVVLGLARLVPPMHDCCALSHDAARRLPHLTQDVVLTRERRKGTRLRVSLHGGDEPLTRGLLLRAAREARRHVPQEAPSIASTT